MMMPNDGFKNFYGVVSYRHAWSNESSTDSDVILTYEDGRRVGPVRLSFEEMRQLDEAIAARQRPFNLMPETTRLEFTTATPDFVFGDESPSRQDLSEYGNSEPQPPPTGQLSIGSHLSVSNGPVLEGDLPPPNGSIGPIRPETVEIREQIVPRVDHVGSGGLVFGGEADIEAPSQSSGQDEASSATSRSQSTPQRIRSSAAVRAVAVEGIDQVVEVLESSELNETERTMSVLALVSLRRARAILTLEWAEMEEAAVSAHEREIDDIRNALERVRDWLLQKSDQAVPSAVVLALSQLLQRL